MARKVVKYEDLYGYEDVLNVITNKKGYEEGWYAKEIEMNYGDGKKLADALTEKGYDVKYDEDDEMWMIDDGATTCHWGDCYWYPYIY